MLDKDYLAILASQPANRLALHSFFSRIANVPIENMILVPNVNDTAQRNVSDHRPSQRLPI
jgi:hypothetical protein